MTIIDFQELSDDELSAVLERAREEYHRRRALVTVLDGSPALTDAHMQSIGRENGAEFVQPTGAHNAYPIGWIVTHEGKEWEATREGAHGVPGESGDWRQVAGEGEILEWVAPTGAHNAYEPGALVVHNGYVWRNDHTAANGWEPGTPQSQWTNLGPVEGYGEGEDPEENEDPEVPEVPEVPEDPEDPEDPEGPEENEILEWVQPTGAHDTYDPGALVVHNGSVWRNDHTAPNGWEPGTVGSQWTDLGPIEEYEGE